MPSVDLLVFWLWVVAGVPQVIVALGWVAYLVLGRASRREERGGDGLSALTSVDIVVPLRTPEGTLPLLLADLQPLRALGARVVLLDSSPGDPGMAGCALSSPMSAMGLTEWLMSETAWGTHCWGPPPAGNKAGVLNLWLAHSEAEIIVVVDADWRLAPGNVSHLVDALRGESGAAFAQGRWEFLNGSASWISRADMASLTVHHRLEQRVRATRACPFNMNGSFMALRRRLVRDVGGFGEDQLSEDVELAFRLAHAGHRGIYVETAYASGRLTTSLAAYQDQKVRWVTGRMQALWRVGLATATRGPMLHRLLGLHYLLEYAPGPCGLCLALLASAADLGTSERRATIGLIVAPWALRFLVTCREARAVLSTRHAWEAALTDAALRLSLSTTCAAVALGTLLGWKPGWRWRSARSVMLPSSAVLTAAALWWLPRQGGLAAGLAWIALVTLLLLEVIAWATREALEGGPHPPVGGPVSDGPGMA